MLNSSRLFSKLKFYFKARAQARATLVKVISASNDILQCIGGFRITIYKILDNYTTPPISVIINFPQLPIPRHLNLQCRSHTYVLISYLTWAEWNKKLKNSLWQRIQFSLQYNYSILFMQRCEIFPITLTGLPAKFPHTTAVSNFSYTKLHI